MSNRFDEFRQAVNDAEYTLRAADSVADDMAQLLEGRLRQVHSWRGIQSLKRIKRELRNFNITTGQWKS